MDAYHERTQEKSTVLLALEPLSDFLADAGITEIVLNRPGIVAIERQGRWEFHPRPALDFDWCMDLAKLLRNRASQDITEAQPLLGAQLPDGQRVQVVIPPAVPPGTDEYLKQPDLRKKVFTACANDPGRKGSDANCVNALQAERIASSGTGRFPGATP